MKELLVLWLCVVLVSYAVVRTRHFINAKWRKAAKNKKLVLSNNTMYRTVATDILYISKCYKRFALGSKYHALIKTPPIINTTTYGSKLYCSISNLVGRIIKFKDIDVLFYVKEAVDVGRKKTMLTIMTKEEFIENDKANQARHGEEEIEEEVNIS